MATQQVRQTRGRVMRIVIAGMLSIVPALATGLAWHVAAGATMSETNRQPGKGPAGSVRLVYQIPSMGPEAGLGERVIEVLRKRIDPDGARNVAWRELGGNQIEILIPLTIQDREAHAAHEAHLQAQLALEQTNIRQEDVDRAITTLGSDGDARKQALEKLAQGSEAHRNLFASMVAAYDQRQKAEASGDTLKQAEAELRYDSLQRQIADANISASELETMLDARPTVVEVLQQRFAGFQKRVDAINQFAKTYAAYRDKRELDSACQIKRLLSGVGALSFHVLVEGQEMASAEAMEMRHRLKPGGKGVVPQVGDEMRWLCVDRPEDLPIFPLAEHDGKRWLLCWATRERSMEKRPGEPPWALEVAYPTETARGARAIGFRFDAGGAACFAALTGGNLKRVMAVALDGRVISAATIQSVISRGGIIARDSGYTDAELTYLVGMLNAGALPAALSDKPIREESVGPDQDSAK